LNRGKNSKQEFFIFSDFIYKRKAKSFIIQKMSADKIQIRRKELPKKGRSKIHFAVIFAVVILIGSIVTLTLLKFSDNFNFFESPLEISTEGNRQIIKVSAGGNLQEAINKAKSGDIIELQAGATYNEIVLPNKALTDFVTIRTSAFAKLPEEKRVSPTQSNLFAKIVTRKGEKSAVSAENGAHHYRFVGIEFTPNNAEYVYNLVYFGTESAKITDVPHDLEIDRCYFHPNKTGIVRRGLALNSANTVIKNSYFEGFAFSGEETQGICGWTGTKNVKVINNYIEGGAENVMFGGSDPASAELIPQDIEVRGNYFNKPENWKGKVSLKCLFELKNAKRVQVSNNIFENNWLGAAFRITVRNDGGKAPFSVIEDVLIQNNTINGAGDGINILGQDDVYPSQMMKNLTISNNLLLNIGDKKYEGSGYFIQVSKGDNIKISNNTSINSGSPIIFHGGNPTNFLFRDNIAGHGNYGIHGFENIKSPTAQKTFANNVFVNNRSISNSETSFSPNNFWVSDYNSVGFVNFAGNDLRLSPNSRFKGKGANGANVGADAEKLPKENVKSGN